MTHLKDSSTGTVTRERQIKPLYLMFSLPMGSFVCCQKDLGTQEALSGWNPEGTTLEEALERICSTEHKST